MAILLTFYVFTILYISISKSSSSILYNVQNSHSIYCLSIKYLLYYIAKPYPDGLLHCCQTIAVDPSRSIYIGGVGSNDVH